MPVCALDISDLETGGCPPVRWTSVTWALVDDSALGVSYWNFVVLDAPDVKPPTVKHVLYARSIEATMHTSEPAETLTSRHYPFR